MAMNPMQKRARNSFIIGFCVALIIMAIVVFILLQKIKSINEAKEAIEQLQTSQYVATTDLESGQEVTFEEDFTYSQVQTTVDPDTVISEEDFVECDEDGVPITTEDGEKVSKKVMMKISVPAGTIVTKDMITVEDEEIEDSQRIAEYNMILLPSHLKNGDYVDIRLSLPTGQDYIVLSKKKVYGTTDQSVWLRLNEDEILTLNNAIVESYIITGSKLYAFQYIEPGLQEASSITYVPNEDVVSMISKSPNVTDEAKSALASRINNLSTVRAGEISSALAKAEEDGVSSSAEVETGVSEEIEKIKSARQSYVSELEGTDDIGYSE